MANMNYIDKLNKNLLKIFYLIACFYIYVLVFCLFLFKYDFHNETQYQLFNIVIFFIILFSIFLYLLFYKQESELNKISWFLIDNVIALAFFLFSYIVSGYVFLLLFDKEIYEFPRNLINVLLVIILQSIYIFELFIRNKTPGEKRLNFISIISMICSLIGVSVFFFGLYCIKEELKFFIGLYSKNYLPPLEFFKIILIYGKEWISWFLYLLFITFISIQYFINYFIKGYSENIIIRENALKESIKYFIYLLIFIVFIIFGDIRIDFLDWPVLMPFVIICSLLVANLGTIFELKIRTFIIFYITINIVSIFWFISYKFYNEELDNVLLKLFNINIILVVKGFMYGMGVIFAMALGILISKWKDKLFKKQDIAKTTKKELSLVTGISANTIHILELYKNNINSLLLEKLEKEGKIKKIEFLVLKDRFSIK